MSRLAEVYPASYPMGTGDPFPGIKRGRRVTLTTHPYIVPRSRIRSYTSSLSLDAYMAVAGDFTFIHFQLIFI
jgi:hypothetical protein